MQQNSFGPYSSPIDWAVSESPWSRMARQWRHNVPPLRPVSQDLEFCWNAAQGWIRKRGVPRVLLLGVTPELYNLPWPKGTDLLAIDRTQSMIDLVWPGPRDAARCMDWCSLALPDSSRDIVLCDGGLHLLKYPQEQYRLILLLKQLLSNQGLCILRLFVPPEQRESPEAVLMDLFEGKIANLSILKLRMGMSLWNGVAEGVALGEIYRKIQDAAPDLEGLAAKIGWPVEHMLAIKSYEGATFRSFYVTVEEATDMFCCSPGGFRVERLHIPSYELGQRCPTMVMKRCSPAWFDANLAASTFMKKRQSRER